MEKTSARQAYWRFMKHAAGDVKEMPAEPQTDMLQKMHPAAKSPFTTAAKPTSIRPPTQNSGVQAGV